MAVPLNTKIKEAFRAYLAQLDDSALDPYDFYRGIRHGNQELPSVSVALVAREPALEADDSPLWNASVLIMVETLAEWTSGSCATTEDAHDAVVAIIEAALSPANQADGIRVFANSENTTTRPAVLDDGAGFHLSEFPQPVVVNHYDRTKQAHVTVLRFDRVQVQATDADA